MNVYIDIGAYNGDSVEEFRNWSKIAFPDKKDWKIYAFEPNPRFIEQWEKISDEKTVFIQKAAWIKKDVMDFAVDQTDTPLGSTLMKGKVKIWDSSPKIKVATFDLSAYLKRFTKDFVVLKIDAEGAEFPILEKMIKDNTDKICDWLLVEFHPNKVVEYTTTHMNELLAKLKSRNPNVRKWH